MSVSTIWRASLAAALIALAVAVIVAKGGALLSGYDTVYADNALRTAAQAEKGPSRDKAVAQAVEFVDNGLRVAPGDPRLWGLRSEALLRQALEGDGARRDKLLSESVAASKNAAASAPNDSATQARLALVLALEGERVAAAAALSRSYELDITSNAFGHRRLEAAGRAWRELGPAGQRNVVNEACMLAARGPEDRARMQRLRFGAADAGMALTLDEVLADGACRGAEG
ncbi:MAG: hypothetical protein WDN76_08630 [Alphaproteobacteria bacterium]